MTLNEMREIKDQFAKEYLSGEKGVYSVGIGMEKGQMVLRVGCSKERIDDLPQLYCGQEIRYRITSQPRVALAGDL